MIQPESSEARKTATEAMSPGWPRRPSGVWAIERLLEVGPMEAGGMRAFGFDHPGIDRVHADLLGPEFAGQHAGNGVHCALGSGVDGGGGGVMRLTTEPMLMMLPPSPICLRAACVVSTSRAH